MNNCTCTTPNNNSNSNGNNICATHHNHQQQQNNNNNHVRSSYHQKALQQIRNSLQPFATVFTPSSSTSSSPLPPPSNNVSHNHNQPQQPPPPPYPFLFPRCPSPQQQQQQQSQPPSPPPPSTNPAVAAYAYYQNNGYFTPLPPPPPPPNNETDYYYAQQPPQQSSGTITPTTTSSSTRQSPSTLVGANLPPPPATRPGAIEYRAQQYPFVPSQVPMNVQQLLRRIDLTNTNAGSRTNSPPLPRYTSNSTITTTSSSSRTPPPPQPQPTYKPTTTVNSKKPTLIIKSTVVPKPVLQTATNVNGAAPTSNKIVPPPPQYNNNPPPPPPPYKDVKMMGGGGNVNVAVQQAPPPPLPPKPKKNNNNEENNKVQSVEQQQQQQQQQPARVQEIIHTHESPIPERKKLSKEKEEERFESKVRVYSPAAFKFFMEQHVENVIKSHQERLHRRLQLESEMAKIGLSEEAQTQMRKMLSQKESNYIRLKRAKMDKSMFKVIRTIGVGAFGEVALVRKIDTQLLYAMKTLRKSDVLARNQVAHVKAERDILAEADNEWVVKLYYSFQDKDHLYFVMDYIPGGDLMSLLIKKGIFEESLAQFYIAELTCAIESVHKMGFIHRDIKPDNILIDRDGHIKLTDFGLCTGFRWTHNSKYYQDNTAACSCGTENTCNEHTRGGPKVLERRRAMMRGKDNIRCLAHSLVGTPNYIAPEVLLRTGYTQLCDWWSVGVILYEMLVGQPPFLAQNPAETQFKVINWEKTLRIPTNACVSSKATNLILKLCTDHSKRLGKNGAHEVKNHPFLYPIFHPNHNQQQNTTASSDYSDTLSTTSTTSYSSSSPSSISSSCSSSSSPPPQPINIRRTLAPYIPKIAHPTDTSNFDPCEEDSTDSRLTFEDEFNDNNQFHGFFEFTFRRFFDDAYHLEDLAAAAHAVAVREQQEQQHHHNRSSQQHGNNGGGGANAGNNNADMNGRDRNGPVYV